MSVTYIGPIALTAHYAPEWSWVGDPGRLGRRASLGGAMRWDEAKAIQELVMNPDRRQTIGDEVGVLEFVWTTLAKQPEFNGLYLLQDCEIIARQVDTVRSMVPIRITALQMFGSLVVTRSARERIDGYDAKSLVVQPFWGETASGEPFDIDPGGTAFSREYDERTEYDPASLIPSPETFAVWDDETQTWDDPDATWAGPEIRRLRIHAGQVT